MDKDKDSLRNFTLNRNIDNYSEFVNYFYNLSDIEKKNIICICIKYKKCNDIKNGNLDKIYNMYKILLHKLQYNNLNYKEKKIYEFIKNTEIFIGEFKNDELFKKYIDKYLKVELNSYKNNLFLIMQDIIIDLNKKYKKNFKLRFSDIDCIACTKWFNKEERYNVLIGKKFIDYLSEWIKNNEDITCIISYTIFVILHEYRHLLQADDYFINNTSNSYIYIKEEFMIVQINNFYKRFHDNFVIEKEANEFAYNNLFNYLNKYINFDEEVVEKHINKIFNIFPKDKKGFLLMYKSIIKYIELNNKIKIKKVDIFFDEVHKLKKQINETYL